MLSSETGKQVLSILGQSVGWVCMTYTFMQILGGKLSGMPQVGLVAGGLVFGLSQFALSRYNRRSAARRS